ncbi:MAG TPA: hypothetical protein VHK22_01635 [Gaiellaceae bacterium]|nr:hypothetical protein [Gaiellaceae bacterium]
MRSVSERYLLLGLRLDRHVDGMVDAYFGPAELPTAVEAEPLAEPGALADDADELLAGLPDGWLRDQVAGLRACAGVLAGEPISYADEVERCYGVRPAHTDEAVFAAAHERLGELLPGDGPLPERKEVWERSIRVPADRLERTVAAVIEQARARTRALVDLPEDEGVDLELVTDKPWLAFCDYLGDLRSRIAVNTDLPFSAIELLRLALHETYPGHHTERACKEQLLVRGRGLLEETIVLVPAPQSLVSEGIAELAPELLLGEDGGAPFVAILAEAGVELDLPHALAVEKALEPSRWVEVNAALMLHEEGADETDVQAYLERWALVDGDLAAHLVRFMREPASRSYILTYAAGRELCRSYVAGDPARFRRLLTEQVRVGELLAVSRG